MYIIIVTINVHYDSYNVCTQVTMCIHKCYNMCTQKLNYVYTKVTICIYNNTSYNVFTIVTICVHNNSYNMCT